jgi:site-specific DNA recombinase
LPWVPAREIEAGIAVILRDHLMKPIALTELVEDISASEIPDLQAKLHGIAEGCDHDRGVELWAPLLRRADISPGRILLRLDRKVLADHRGIKPERISPLVARSLHPSGSRGGASKRRSSSVLRPPSPTRCR